MSQQSNKYLSAKENKQVAVRHVRIGPEADGQRVDNFLAGELPGVPRGRIYRMLRKGEVRINKGRVKPTTRVRTGDEVRIPPVTLQVSATPGVPASLAKQLRGAVLYEDRDLLVIDKPAGIAVHGGSGVSLGCVEALRALEPHWRDLGLAHRLVCWCSRSGAVHSGACTRHSARIASARSTRRLWTGTGITVR